VFPNVEVRYLHAVVVLAEELNFTHAAQRLRISNLPLSKQITEIEEATQISSVHSRQETGCRTH